ncbi:MAG TPA: DegT/DnrJ/EryC1/StrS family aminotransferase [Armatimonadota bacterium]|jgi:dTDP-4-amino-4,6-dideoxygalactose transaminase
MRVEKPAIAGGQPAKVTPYGKANRYGEEELAELKEALEQGSLFYAHGHKVTDLEAAFADFTGAAHAVATSSGTAAIHAAMIAAGISPGDEVIVAPITDMGSVIPILYQGAIPVFADLDPRTYCLDPTAVEAAISVRTTAVVAVHLWGNACDVQALRTICDRQHITLIEDAAQAHGATVGGKSVGRFGAVGCFSFNEFKHVACGDGGICITDDEAVAHRLRLATDKCYDRSPSATSRNPTFLANNYRMTELQGAVAVAQMRKLGGIVERRRAWCEALSRRLMGLPGILPPLPTVGANPSWWFYMLRVEPSVLGVDADGFAAALREEGLPAFAHYIGQPVYTYPIFADHLAFARGMHPYDGRTYRKGLCPAAEEILGTSVVLAVNEAYTDTDLLETAAAFEKVVAWYCNGAQEAPHT